MREALASAGHDFVVTGPATKIRQLRARLFSGTRRNARRKTRRGRPYLKAMAGACFALLTGGILLNALVWQKSRHPAPLFARTVSTLPPKAQAGLEAAAPPAQRSQSLLLPGMSQGRPAEKSAVPKTSSEPAPPAAHAGADPRQTRPNPAPPEAKDPITQLLQQAHEPPARGAVPASKPAAPSRESVLAAQRALVKLGYVLKADGVAGASTLEAVRRYERERHLTVRGELTPARIRQIIAEAGAPPR
ncbi:MAG TPA: peptidoglycan-binding domain-containing protein [Methylocella sp.]|nr:peptidoglycan-binding domain-containing protein [Methylocella sp.]